MSLQDPIADMIARIKNAQLAGKDYTEMPFSKLKESILKVLLSEGYIESIEESSKSSHKILKIKLKYYDGNPVIQEIKRISRPGLRLFKKSDELPKVANGLGVSIISTSSGVMTDKQARKAGVGGEVICTIF